MIFCVTRTTVASISWRWIDGVPDELAFLYTSVQALITSAITFRVSCECLKPQGSFILLLLLKSSRPLSLHPLFHRVSSQGCPNFIFASFFESTYADDGRFIFIQNHNAPYIVIDIVFLATTTARFICKAASIYALYRLTLHAQQKNQNTSKL